MNYTETAGETAFHNYVGGLSTAVGSGLLLMEGRSSLYTHPSYPGCVFRPIVAGTKGRGVRSLAFFNGAGAIYAVAGKSLEHLKKHWLASQTDAFGDNPMATMCYHRAPKSSDGTLVSLLEQVARVSASTSDGAGMFNTTWKTHQAKAVSDSVYTRNVISPANRPVRVFELLTSADAGIFTNTDAQFKNGDIGQGGGINEWMANLTKTDTRGLMIAANPVAGYLGKSLDLGPTLLILGDPGVRDAILATYPTDHDIASTAAELYASTLSATFTATDRAVVGFYYNMATGELTTRARKPIALATVSDTGATSTGKTSTALPVTDTATTTVYTPAINFGDYDASLPGETWHRIPLLAPSMVNLRGGTLGKLSMDVVERVMFPGKQEFLNAEVSVTSLDPSLGLDSVVKGLNAFTEASSGDGAVALSAQGESYHLDSIKLSQKLSSNMVDDTFVIQIVYLLRALDNAVKNALS